MLLTLLCKSTYQLEAWSDFVVFGRRGPKSLLGHGMDPAATDRVACESIKFGESITACVQLDRAASPRTISAPSALERTWRWRKPAHCHVLKGPFGRTQMLFAATVHFALIIT